MFEKPSNKGSGRLQFAKFFEETVLKASLKTIVLSRAKRGESVAYPLQKDICQRTRLLGTRGGTDARKEPSLLFQPLNRKDRSYYEQIMCDELKEKFISLFYSTFANENIPTI